MGFFSPSKYVSMPLKKKGNSSTLDKRLFRIFIIIYYAISF